MVATPSSGSEEGVFWKRGLFGKVHSLEILENVDILENLENPQTLESKGESDHFLEIPAGESWYFAPVQPYFAPVQQACDPLTPNTFCTLS